METSVSSFGFEYGVKHFHAPDVGLVEQTIKSVLNLSDDSYNELFNLGSIYVSHQRLTDPNKTISAGELIRVHTKSRRYFCGYDWTSLIVYENSDYLILNKPSGIPSHPSVDNKIENSLTQTEFATNQKLLISHRLDTTTEGLIVYGKTKDFVKSFNIQIQNHLIQKNYVALCETEKIVPKTVIHYMKPSPRAPKEVSPIFIEGWDFCELKVLAQKKIDLDLSWIKIDLLTGRTHQIRTQMAELGAPLCGDMMYGAKTPWSQNRNATQQVALRSQRIEFTWKSQTVKYELPEDFLK